MEINKTEITAILAKYNPWWQGKEVVDLPTWRRVAFEELFNWVIAPPAPRAVLLSGARQIGKTTLLRQVIEALLKQGTPSANILFASFDDSVIKYAGIEAVLEAWREREPAAQGPEYLFLDEAQFIPDYGTWVKHQVDFFKNRRIIFTGSAMPFLSGRESGVGRWHTLHLGTLSFYEYLELNQFTLFVESETEKKFIETLFDTAGIAKGSGNENKSANFLKELKLKYPQSSLFRPLLRLPELPSIKDLPELFDWQKSDFLRVAEAAAPYTGHFHQYLLRGGFPQIAKIENIDQAQKLLRSDLIDKVLNRDLTAIFGVRSMPDLEKVFLYLCMHDGGLLNMQTLIENLGVTRPTAERYLELLEDIYLIYRLRPFGYGKEILRSNHKIYLADTAIISAILLKGKNILDDENALGRATEAAVYKHLLIHYPHFRFTYWQHKEKNQENEVDLIAEINAQVVPFEVKYRNKHITPKQLKGLMELCRQNPTIKQAYVVTKSIHDFGLHHIDSLPDLKILHIPAALLCYWLQ